MITSIALRDRDLGSCGRADQVLAIVGRGDFACFDIPSRPSSVDLISSSHGLRAFSMPVDSSYSPAFLMQSLLLVCQSIVESETGLLGLPGGVVGNLFILGEVLDFLPSATAPFARQSSRL